MSWIVISLLAATITALISICDKTIMGYARSRLTLPLLIGFSQTGVGIVIIIGAGVPDAATWEGVG